MSLEFKLEQEGKDNFLVIKCKLPKKASESKSKKSLLHATSNGNMNTGLKIGGKDLIVGLNAYTKVE